MKATARIDNVTRERVVTETERMVTMTIPYDHAVSLGIVMENVGGSPNGRRGDIKRIIAALHDAGVYLPRDPETNCIKREEYGEQQWPGSFYFADVRPS